MERIGRNDMESKAVKETVTERGREGVSIIEDKGWFVRSLRPFTCRDRQAILFS